MGSDRLLQLGFRLVTVALARCGAAAWALPGEGHLGLDGHGDLEVVTVGAVVDHALAWSELDAALIFKTGASET
jgi:hypothetical protein